MYFVYILECENNSLYTGITTDIVRRFKEHVDCKKNRKGAKFTLAFKPKRIVAAFSTKDRSSAAKLEALIKKQNKATKLSILSVYKSEHLLKSSKIYIPSSKIMHLLDS